MKNTIFSLALLLASFSASFDASASVIGFDDLPGVESEAIENGYQGFDWYNVGAISADAYPGSGYEAGTVSFGNTAFNLYGDTAAISKAGGFHFVGAWFTSAWMDQEIAFEGYRDGELRYASASSYAIDTFAPQWIGLGWGGIDTLVIYNSTGTQWAMDEFTVPEPASLALFGTAMAGMLLAPRTGRRRKAASAVKT